MEKTQNNIEEENDKKRERKASVVSLISGKGGAGKTTVAVSMAKLLAELSYKVLLIDVDLATHGLSYFFIDEIKKKKSKGLIETFRDWIEEYKLLSAEEREHWIEKEISISYSSDLLHIENLFDFLPSKTYYQAPSLNFLEKSSEFFEIFIKITIKQFRGEYDFLILDAQAGPTFSSYDVVSVSDKAIIVTEPDPISVAAIRNLDHEFREIFPNETFYLMNMMFFDEIEAYRTTVEVLEMLNYLPPLPFDMDVRRAFARRIIPIDFEEPTAFLFGIVRMSEELLPEIREILIEFEKKLREGIFKPLRKYIDGINAQIKQLDKERKENIRRSNEYRLLPIIMILMVTITLLTQLFISYKYEITYFLERLSNMDFFVIYSVLITLTVFYLYNVFIRRKQIPEETLSIIESRRKDLLEEKNKYEVLLLTRSREFLIKPEVFKDIKEDRNSIAVHDKVEKRNKN